MQPFNRFLLGKNKKQTHNVHLILRTLFAQFSLGLCALDAMMLIHVKASFLAVSAAILLASCASAQVVPAGTSTITLNMPQRRPAGLGFVVFPAGTYTPDFQTADGIYYRAPTHLAGGGPGFSRPLRGGLFIPFANRPNQNQAAWFDEQENASLLLAATTSTTRLWRFSEPVAFTRP